MREVAGSNPVVPTISINHLRRSVTVAAGRLWGKLQGLFRTREGCLAYVIKGLGQTMHDGASFAEIDGAPLE